jgi:hypothetical protein
MEDRELLTQTMVGLNVDAETIATLMDSFDQAAAHLESNPVAPVPHASFGDSYTGGHRLATNAQMAHDSVGTELQRMVLGLRGMAESLGAFASDVERTTEQTLATMRLYEASVECVAAPKIAAGTCSAPQDSED